MAKVAPEKQLRKLLRQLGKRLELLDPPWRRSGLRERSEGATSWCSRPASRSADVLNVRRCRAEMP